MATPTPVGPSIPSDAEHSLPNWTITVPASVPRNSLQYIVQYWKGVHLDQKKVDLEKQVAEIADNIDVSLSSRKKLAEQTKDFRKLPEPDKQKSFGNLLKLYQEEIDKLTKRSKLAEASFFLVYKLLSEAPDPSPPLSSALDDSNKNQRIIELELENKKYKTELDEFKKEFHGVQNQEVTIRRLQDQVLEYESKMDELIHSKVDSLQKNIQEENQTKMKGLKDREDELQNRLQSMNKQLQNTETLLEQYQSEIMQLKKTLDEKQFAKQSEWEILLAELEKYRTLAGLYEQKANSLGNSHETQLDASKLASDEKSIGELKWDINQKEFELQRLREMIAKMEQNYLFLEKTSSLELERLKLGLSQEQKKVEHLTKDLKDRPSSEDFQQLKQQVSLLQRALECEDEETVVAWSDLESILKSRNKKLETNNINLRAKLSERENSAKDLETEVVKLRATIEDLQNSLKRLEEDLSRGVNPNKQSADVVVVGDEKMLQIVTNQRDRFKLRMSELESETKELAVGLQSKDTELNALKQDNVKLYEKIRYLQSYGHKFKGDVESAKDEVEERYSRLYEESNNPFVLFNRKEQYRRYKQLNPAEKVVLRGGQFFLSTKFSRLFLFCYSVVLHLLVFLTLYKSAHTGTSSSNSN